MCVCVWGGGQQNGFSVEFRGSFLGRIKREKTAGQLISFAIFPMEESCLIMIELWIMKVHLKCFF